MFRLLVRQGHRESLKAPSPCCRALRWHAFAATRCSISPPRQRVERAALPQKQMYQPVRAERMNGHHALHLLGSGLGDAQSAAGDARVAHKYVDLTRAASALDARRRPPRASQATRATQRPGRRRQRSPPPEIRQPPRHAGNSLRPRRLPLRAASRSLARRRDRHRHQGSTTRQWLHGPSLCSHALASHRTMARVPATPVSVRPGTLALSVGLDRRRVLAAHPLTVYDAAKLVEYPVSDFPTREWMRSPRVSVTVRPDSILIRSAQWRRSQ